jgi:hypothetical protein
LVLEKNRAMKGCVDDEWWFKESTNDGQNLEEAKAFEGLWSFWSEMAFEQKCKKMRMRFFAIFL